jgi:hypothetical protein
LAADFFFGRPLKFEIETADHNHMTAIHIAGLVPRTKHLGRSDLRSVADIK